MKKALNTLLLASALGWAGTAAHAQHGHLNAGALGTAQGDALYFANGALFAEASGYVKSLAPTTTGNRAGYYSGSITLTALPATVANGGPAAGAPALGSFVQYAIVSVTGPAGGEFAFWEAGATAPSLRYASGYATATPTLIALSDVGLGAGAAGADPFGHLHGRAFTATVPGEYVVGFQLFDTSVNGAGGAAIHSPSQVLSVKFAAVPEPGTVALVAVGASLVLWAGVRRRERN